MSKREPGSHPLLPAFLRPLFWDQRFSRLSWERDRDLVAARVLSAGDWGSVRWLRGQMGDAALRTWLLEHQGAGLDPRRLRFWELILKLPHAEVNRWLASPERAVWDRRAAR
jgi:hypothetical protein